MNETVDFEVNVGPVFITLLISLWVVALVLNSISSVLLLREARQRHSWANILLFLIALLDLLVLFFVLIPAILAIFYNKLLQTNTGLCYFQGCGLNTFVLFIFFLAVCVSIDQYLAICHPFMYSTQVLRHQTRSFKILILVLCVLFFASLMLSVLPKVVGADFGPLTPPLLCYYNLHSRLIENIVFSSINTTLMISNSCVLLFCSVAVGYQFFRLHQSSLAKHSSTHVAGPARSATVSDRQQVALAKLSIIIAIVFLSCSIPFEVVSVLHLLSFHTSESIDYLVLCMLMVGTVVNPFLYMLVRASVRKVLVSYFKKLVQFFNCCRPRLRKGSIITLGGNVIGLSHNMIKQGNTTVTPNSMKRVIPSSANNVYYTNSSSVTNTIPIDVSPGTSGNVRLIKIRRLLSDDCDSLCEFSTIVSEPTAQDQQISVNLEEVDE